MSKPAPTTKRQVVAAMKLAGIAGEVTGAGKVWEVELPDEKTMRTFQRKVTRLGGYKTGYGAYVLRPGYQSQGEWSNPASRCHY